MRFIAFFRKDQNNLARFRNLLLLEENVLKSSGNRSF